MQKGRNGKGTKMQKKRQKIHGKNDLSILKFIQKNKKGTHAKKGFFFKLQKGETYYFKKSYKKGRNAKKRRKYKERQKMHVQFQKNHAKKTKMQKKTIFGSLVLSDKPKVCFLAWYSTGFNGIYAFGYFDLRINTIILL